MKSFFASSLTDEERRLGFLRALVPNSLASLQGEESLAWAVVYPLRESERIVKVGKDYYHQA
jgi:hypothetical protein